MKKFLSFFAFVAIVFSFAACGDGGNVPAIPDFQFLVQALSTKDYIKITATDPNAYFYAHGYGYEGETVDNFREFTENYICDVSFQQLLEDEDIFQGSKKFSGSFLIPDTKYVYWACRVEEDPETQKARIVGNIEYVIYKTMPEYTLNGVFTVGNGQQVYFAEGNLQATTNDYGANWTWSIAPNQYDRINNGVANNELTGDRTVSENGTIDLFGWSTPSTYYGITPSKNNSDYSGNFKEWGKTIGADWYTLSADQWEYLFLHRPNAKKLFGFGYILPPNSYRYTRGIFILPDNWDDAKRAQFNFVSAEEDGNVPFVVDGDKKYYDYNGDEPNRYDVIGSGDDITWADLEAEGVVFLPAANHRDGTVTNGLGTGFYWTSTPKSVTEACFSNFSSKFYIYNFGDRYAGQAVRLVRNAN